jgi:beta-lactamase superfamily II metal-dependent hydrolase
MGTLPIRRVNVEFLRPGRSHNQLLSPYTPYLAICNDAGVDTVRVPYEHRIFERRLKELRYETGDQSDRTNVLHEIGTDMGRLLESVPGLTGELAPDRDKTEALVHLRITLSAAELAMLPFELAFVPVGSSGSPVSIQPRPPISITRHIRTVSSDAIVWPSRPRILFIAGDPDNIPFEEHRAQLMAVIEPFQYPDRDEGVTTRQGREQFGDLLTILVNPSLANLQRECSDTAYTHVHVLTHGDLDVMTQESYGLALRDESGAPDVVSGERFISAIVGLGHRPTVVTIASCDSGNVGSVIIPGASFAHAVHQAGIPFVVGAQFPLSKEGSIPLARRLYEGLLWGNHPLHVVHRARAELNAAYGTTWHDWASVIVYESLPTTLDDQLETLQYSQAKRAMNAALERIDNAVRPTHARVSVESMERLKAAVMSALQRMPMQGQFEVECLGVRASSSKRLAHAAFTRSQQMGDSKSLPDWDVYDLLDRARLDYRSASKGLLVTTGRAAQRIATLHWVMVQLVSLSVVLEGKCELGEWETARVCADHYRNHDQVEERAWAHGSLAELWLLRLAEPGMTAEQAATYIANALSEADALSRLYPGVDDFPVKSTRRQFERYAYWWGEREFVEKLRVPAVTPRLKETAERLVKALERREPNNKRGVARTNTGGSEPTTQPTLAGGGSATSHADKASLEGASSRGKEKSARGDARVTSALATAKQTAKRDGPFFDIEVLPAGHGDCLWIEYGDTQATHRWLIDCGTQATSKVLRQRVAAVPEDERRLELFVLSHIDSDHIGGALPFFRAIQEGLRIGDVWFNGWRHISGQLGARQGEMFSTAILDFELPWNEWRAGKTIVVDGDELPIHDLPGGMRLTLLSPRPTQLQKLKPVWTRELKKNGLVPGERVDYRRFLKGTPSSSTDIDELADAPFLGDKGAPNGTSIAVLAEFGGASALLAADAHADVLAESIRLLLRARGGDRLKVDVFKVSHHGSQNNVSSELIRLLECPNYIVSTNGDHFCHPDRQAIARVLKHSSLRPMLHFNYRTKYNDVWARQDLQAQHRYTARYPAENEHGIRVPLINPSR